MKSKTKSLAAILALSSSTTLASASSIADVHIEVPEEGVVAEEKVTASNVRESSAPRNRNAVAPRSQQRQQRTPKNGRRLLLQTSNNKGSRIKKKPAARRRDVEQQQQPRNLSSSTSSAPGCGPTAGTHHSPYLGCFNDKSNNRAFKYELHRNLSKSKRLGNGALDCERECTSRGYRYFAREFKGQCFCGNVIESIVRHGKSADGCDCCGGNVGGGRMCVWENANHKDSNAEAPIIPMVLPQLSRQEEVSTVAIQPMHSHITAPSSKTSYVTTTSIESKNDHKVVQASTHKPTGSFRLRLHWEKGYNWQGSSSEKFFCMECRGSCNSGSSIQIDKCSNSNNRLRQKFLAVGKTIRSASNPSLCLTVNGYNGKGSPIKLRRCENGGGSNQKFNELRANGKFELQPEGQSRRCLSQHHHPRDHEAVYPAECDKTRKHDTTYWTTY